MPKRPPRVSASFAAQKGVAESPPSIASLPSQPDPLDPSPERLEQIIRDLPLRNEGEDNAAAEARELFQCYALASLARGWQKKAGTVDPISVARDLKRIASKSSTLLELLKRADRKTFEAWAGAQYPEAVTLERAVQEWLQLKNMLEITAQRASQSARGVEKSLKSLTRPESGKRGRPIDQLADLITIEAAAVYERRTGKHAVRKIDRASHKPLGDFHNFLTRVFEVLQIEASPDARNMQLQTELRSMKK